jgi:hypothetical protein
MECRCAACGRAFRPRSQVQEQRYCELPACQRERRRRWKWSKRHSDEDYRQNQALAQRAWAESHADYWCNYRLAHADYVERNRLLQRERDRRRRVADLAKRNASESVPPVPSGIYRMALVTATDLAKRNVWTVKITVLSNGYGMVTGDGGILQREDVIGTTGLPC